MPDKGELVQCPRCWRWFHWKDEYVNHAWKER